ncbi:TPA: hypothetical protein EYP44_05755, partial [Candidatus Bathyarchaeota archaeon]|nr:hypothetical protein [Candidatus Bathyarchaeota archaeon]
MSKILGVIRLFRPINCLMMGFAVIVGALLVARGGVLARGQPLGLLLGFLAGFALTGASMAVNDYCDREIDAINEPSRPIPSGAVGACEALFYAFLLATIGFISALLNNLRCLSVAAVAFLLLVLYVTKGKRTGLPGNLMVSACVSIPFVYGAFIVKEELDPVVALFIAMVFLSNTGREVTKGIVDIPGDRSKGVKTIASSFGKRAAAATATLFFATSVS